MLGQNAHSTTQRSFAEHVGANGSDTTAYVRLIADDFSILSGADIADIAHFLCILHGRHPGVIDRAATKTADDAARTWLVQATDGFVAERSNDNFGSQGPIIGVSGRREGFKFRDRTTAQSAPRSLATAGSTPKHTPFPMNHRQALPLIN